MDLIAAYFEGRSCSNTMRIARSLTSGEYLFDFFMSPNPQCLESPPNSGWFIVQLTRAFIDATLLALLKRTGKFYMVVLTVCNHKGGTGKTTSSIHLAAAFGLVGYRVMVVDFDPQSFLTRALGVGEPSVEASSLMLFSANVPMNEVERLNMASFDLLPSSSGLTNAMRKLNKPTDVLWTREALQSLEGLYDIVLFDTAAALTVFSLNALVASEHVLIPVTPEYQPVMGAEQTYRTSAMVQDKLNPDLNEPHFLFTQVDARKRNHHKYRQYLRKRYDDRVLSSVIRTSAALSTSYGDGTTVFEHAPSSRGARDYANAADEVLRVFQFPPPIRDDSSPNSAPYSLGRSESNNAPSSIGYGTNESELANEYVVPTGQHTRPS